MYLTDALRLNSQPRLVFVGAGGKTTALFQLARELLAGTPQRKAAASVLVSATTHLAVQQLALSDRYFIIQTSKDLDTLEKKLPNGVVLCIGPEVEPERMGSLQPELLARLREIAETQQCPLLLEGDGSRRRPLKAPAAHEPVIPEWADTVVVVAGLSGIGQPLSDLCVHRPEIFRSMCRLEFGEKITVNALADVLNHSMGGLKGIPDSARRVALLNQADDADCQASAKRLAGLLQRKYQSVLVAALAPRQHLEASKRILAVFEPVAGVVLAAGASSRLGKPKQVLPWRGEPLVRHVARAALSAGLSPVLVVTGSAAAEVQAALQDLPVVVVNNPAWQEGQSSSLKTGLAALPGDCGAAVFLLADQPQVSPELVRGLVELHSQTLSPLVAPLVNGRRGNPVLFDQCTFADLNDLSGDVGGRALFSHYQAAWLPWHDSDQGLDVDTEEDYARLLEMRGEE